MAGVRLPLPQQGKDLNQTVNNLFDTVLMLRKELEFALLNLDSDNIPMISSLVTGIDGAYSLIEQTNEAITLKVSSTDYNGNTIASLINQTSHAIELSAINVDLSGVVTISDLADPYNATVINGARIATGTVMGSVFTNLIGTVNNPTYSHCLEIGDKDGFQAFSFFESTNHETNPPSNSNNIFSVYDGDFGYVSLASKLGFTFLTVNSASLSSGEVTPRGTWNFTNASITGFSAVWG